MINDELRTIANFYGNVNQYNKLQEELEELIEAIDEDNLEHIAEEIADVEIMLEQIKYLSNLYETVKLQKDYKIMRQLQRVHKEASAKDTIPSYKKAAKATLEFLEDRARTEANEEKQKEGRVDKPSHYMLDGLNVEAIDVIRAVLGIEGFKKHCRGCALKYLLRANKKNGLEDLKKARVYLNWEIDYGCDN